LRSYVFSDRADAGRRLASVLDAERLRREHAVVLGIPNGGVVVAYEVARALQAPLDFVCVRGLPAPDDPDLHIGAIGEDGVLVVNQELAAETGVVGARLDVLVAAERVVLHRRQARYLGVQPHLALDGHTALLVDDGVVTGLSAIAAARAVEVRGPVRIVIAVPISPPEAFQAVFKELDQVICLEQPPLTLAIEEWYEAFPDVSEEEAAALLAAAAPRSPSSS
jgi:predicted phosphoribosyltransferase